MDQELDTQPKQNTPQAWATYWADQMQAAEKRLKTFQHQGQAVNTRFLSERLGSSGETILDDTAANMRLMRTNFFHNNIQTLSAQLYGSVPKVDVSREHADPSDDIARVAALLFQRILMAEVTSSDEAFPTAVRSALQDRLLPGLGVCRVRYDLKTKKEIIVNPATGLEEELESIESESAPVEYTHWQDFRWGWCRTWTEMPWCAFRSYLDKEAAINRFGEEIANDLEYKEQSSAGLNTSDDPNTANKNNIQTAQIWEIWRKRDKKVFWWAKGPDVILDMKEDPLELENFWPLPRPLMANLSTSLMTPKADYLFAQDIYNEIDILATRISNITAACKVVGVYDSSSGPSVGRMLNEGTENTLIPVESWSVLSEKGGLKGVIDWFPVEDIAGVLTLLNSQLEATKALLYEVTGMSDIISGGKTDEYTSDGTNRLKAKFGSIKIQSFQDEFARFASDLESIKAEIISKHFSPESIAKQSNAQFINQVDQQYLEPAVQLMKSPDVKWRIKIKPESISLADYASLKSERVEYMVATATYLQSANPIIEASPASKPLLLEILKFGLSAFKGSDYMEGIFDQMIDAAIKEQEEPQEQEQDPELLKAQADMQKIDAKKQADIEISAAKSQMEIQKIQVDNQADLSVIKAKSDADNNKIMLELQTSLKEIMAKLDADSKVEQVQSQMAIAEKTVENDNITQQDAMSHAYRMREIEAQNDLRENKENDMDD
tara:strand:- start:355 stop:2520 length:2166 start_codon:yes stop_codon:yes gene_type:complete